MVADPCWVLGGWKNKYGNKDTRLTEANDSVAFSTLGNEEKRAVRKRNHLLQMWKVWTLLKQM